MAIVKPTELPRWSEAAGAQGAPGPNELVPSSAQQDSGWVPGSEPPAQYFNWYQRILWDWVQYLKQAFFAADAGSNNSGASGTGDGTGPGMLGTGSAAGSRGGRFVGTGNNPGVRGEGSGTDAGGDFVGGPTGPGARFVPGGGATPARGAMAAPAQVAPSAPVDGDGWYDGAGLFWRIAGATKQLLLTAAGVLARSQLPTVGQQVSGSSGAFFTVSAAFVDVTNLSVTITTTGRPVMLFIQPDGSTNAGLLVSAGGHIGAVQFLRGATFLAAWTNAGGGELSQSPVLDAPAAGTYTYKVQAQGDGVGQIQIQNWKLVAYEL